MEETKWVGVDVAKASFDVALELGSQKYRTRAKIGNHSAGFEQLLQWLGQHAGAGAWVVMEATGVYHERLAEFLVQQGVRVSVVNPARTAAFGKSELSRSKTDKSDAKLIARFAKAQGEGLREWKPDPPAVRKLRALVRRLEDLRELERMELNRLEVADETVHASIRTVLASLEKEIAATLQAIASHIDSDPDLRGQRDVLVTIPGIAQATAALLLSELGDMRRFDQASEVVAFAGLNPKVRESGKFKGRTVLSKTGSARLRAGIYMPSVRAMGCNPVLQRLAERLRERGKAGKVIVCAAMSKLLQLAYGVLKSGRPFDPHYSLAGA